MQSIRVVLYPINFKKFVDNTDVERETIHGTNMEVVQEVTA
jgi:hypothetical protein